MLYRSYRMFHKGLWNVLFAPPCKHPRDELRPRRLGVDIVTVKGLSARSVTERIVVCLVKADSRSRWLAVATDLDVEVERYKMLRGEDCCEDCAVNAAASKEDKWLVII